MINKGSDLGVNGATVVNVKDPVVLIDGGCLQRFPKWQRYYSSWLVINYHMIQVHSLLVRLLSSVKNSLALDFLRTKQKFANKDHNGTTNRKMNNLHKRMKSPCKGKKIPWKTQIGVQGFGVKRKIANDNVFKIYGEKQNKAACVSAKAETNLVVDNPSMNPDSQGLWSS